MVKTIKNFFKFADKIDNSVSQEGKTIIQLQQQGSSGTQIYSGYLFEDYLSEMTNVGRANIFDKMVISDYQVQMCLSAVINPIKSAHWEIEQGEDTPEAEKDAELIKHILFNDMDNTFDSFLDEALTFISFGYSLFEIIHKVVLNHPEFGNYTGLKKLAWRSQKTIYSWKIDKDTEDLVSVYQQSYGDSGKTVNIPAEFLLLFNMNAKGSNFEGVSFLRNCYGNWKRKNNYLKLNAAGIERFAIPTPTVEVPVGKEDSVEYSNLIAVLQGYTSHQNNYLTYPQGWNVKLNPNAGFDPSKIEASIDSEDKRMSKAFLTNFLELGMNGSGAFALSNDLSDFFLGGIVHIANEICKKINQKLIPDIVNLNSGPKQFYPKLKVSNIDNKAGKELADILSVASNAKIIIPDDQLEDHFRERFNLPVRSEEGQRTNTPPAFGQPTTMSEKIIAALRGKQCRK